VKRRKPFRKSFLWLASLFAGWCLVAPLLAKLLIVEKPLSRADAILVLAGSATYRERTAKAAEIFRSGVAAHIFLTDDGERSGWSHAEQRNIPYVELARRNLIENGVPPDKIEILEPPVAGTIDEARVLRRKIADEPVYQSVLLVTSSYHTRRVLQTFERIFAEENRQGGETSKPEIGILGVPPGEQTPPPSVWWLTPFGWTMVAGEYLKLIYYWAFY
jgi:uncharacterized SAM-binding protein YcdF (DUF218 family)